MTLSERLRRAMDQAGINQKTLAAAVKVKPPSVNGWLSGKSKFLRGENLLKAADALGVNPDWLATGEGPMALEARVMQPSHASQQGQLDPATLVEAVKLVEELWIVQEGEELEVEDLKQDCTYLAFAYSYLTKKKAQTERVQTNSVVVEFSKYVRSQGAKSGERLGVDAGSHRKGRREKAPHAGSERAGPAEK